MFSFSVSDIRDMGVYVEKVKSLEQENRELQSSRMELMAQVEFTFFLFYKLWP
jgi:hypothetical protein